MSSKKVSEKGGGMSPAELAVYCSGGKFQVPPHISYLNDILLKAANREILRVIINMPPRHGKSEFISKYFPFWYLGNFPDQRIILTSYESRFAQSWGRKVRELVDEFGEKLYGIKLNKNSRAASGFDIEGRTGGMSTAGAGGAITGKGADLLIIDDPVKNDKQANSIVMRENIWDWYKATAYTRLEPDGIVLIVMTRWHEDDLCGKIKSLSSNPEFDIFDEMKWESVRFPALAETEDALGRKPGEALWKERFPEKKLRAIKANLGEIWFEGLYQQSPSPIKGNIFKKEHFRYFKTDDDYYYLFGLDMSLLKTYPKKECRIFTAVDLAISTKSSADFTVAVTCAGTPGRELLVLDVSRKKIEPAEHLAFLKMLDNSWHPELIGIESVQYQSSLVQLAIRENLKAMALTPDSDKLTRSLTTTAKISAGMVYFLKSAFWLDEFEKELLLFNNGKHDDQVDALAYACRMHEYSANLRLAGSKRKSE